MTTYCNGKSKATLLFTRFDGTKGKLTFTNTPITVTCLERTFGKYIFTLATSGSTSACEGDGSYRFGGDRVADSYTIGEVISFGGLQCPVRIVTYSPGGATDIIHPIEYRITQRNNPNYSETSGIEVKNSNGTVLFKEMDIMCNWIVNCDDDCPEGFCKCPQDEYPGYCCVDCNSTANELRSIANAIRGIR